MHSRVGKSDVRPNEAPPLTPAMKVVVAVMTVGIACLLISCFFVTAIFNFNIDLHPASAKILDKHVRTDVKYGDDYVLDYSYDVGGKSFRTHDKVTKYTWSRLNIGDTVNIKYFGPLPGNSRLDFKDYTFPERKP